MIRTEKYNDDDTDTKDEIANFSKRRKTHQHQLRFPNRRSTNQTHPHQSHRLFEDEKNMKEVQESLTSMSRVILLLDLDCFYAQCEVVRLGLDRALPVALVQWNSALAVNYPARECHIQRGDSFEMIQQKSKGKCVAIHLPVKSYQDPNLHMAIDATDHPDAEDDEDELLSIEEAYTREFCIPREKQIAIFENEKNIMRNQSDGKASLDRYRLASARIFDVILKALLNHIGQDNFILERASIDELFIDVTKHCNNFQVPAWNEDEENAELSMDALDTIDTNKVHTEHDHFTDGKRMDLEHVLQGTVIFGHDSVIQLSQMFMGRHEMALIRGCQIASGIRTQVYRDLGFTMSAGVAQSKALSKLAASFGKPNGQCVIFPQALPKLLDETKVRKVRNLGGKIGKQVLSLLPESEDTLGSVARRLSLDQLSVVLGIATGRMVFDLARGIDYEPVKSTLGALTKTITSFKSFPRTINIKGLEKWINLLASDIITRIDLDTKRNRRYPKTCTIHFHSADEQSVGSSVRIPFPSNIKFPSVQSRIDQVKDHVRETIRTKGKFPINRLGLCATNFEVRAKEGEGIEAFLGPRVLSSSTTSTSLKSDVDMTNTPLSVHVGDHGANRTLVNVSGKDPVPMNYSNVKDWHEISSTPLMTQYPSGLDWEKKTKPSVADNIESNLKPSCAPHRVTKDFDISHTHGYFDSTCDSNRAVGKILKECGNPSLHDIVESISWSTDTLIHCEDVARRDIEYARKLQESYDRENVVLTSFDKHPCRSNRLKDKNYSQQSKRKNDPENQSFLRRTVGPNIGTIRIDSYFRRRTT